ncbi:flippase-like domain-containing protein [bacterium]|nr:flippase-like domain-containing protein [bacterium]
MNRESVRAAARVILALAVLGFLVAALIAQAGELAARGARPRPLWLAVATALNLVFFLVQAAVWRELASRVGGAVSPRTAVSAWSLSQISKYVPGKVMLFIVRVAMMERAGVPRGRTLLSIYIELIVMLVTSAVWFAFAVPALSAADAPFVASGWFLATIVIAAPLLLHPRAIGGAVNLMRRRRGEAPAPIEVRFSTMAFAALALGGGWLLHGLAGLACFRAIDIAPGIGIVTVTAIFAGGWLVGFLSFLTPGGLGVREGALALLLSTVHSMDVAIAVALIARLAWMLAEAILALYGWRARPLALESA